MDLEKLADALLCYPARIKTEELALFDAKAKIATNGRLLEEIELRERMIAADNPALTNETSRKAAIAAGVAADVAYSEIRKDTDDTKANAGKLEIEVTFLNNNVRCILGYIDAMALITARG